jgi:hypothetical protein
MKNWELEVRNEGLFLSNANQAIVLAVLGDLDD